MGANELGLLLIAVAVVLFGASWYGRRHRLASAKVVTALLLIECVVVIGTFLSAFLGGWAGGIAD